VTGLALSLGFLDLAVSTVAVVAGAWRLAVRWWPTDRSAAVAGTTVLSSTLIVLVLELLGTASLLGPAQMLIAALAVYMACHAYTKGATGRFPRVSWRRPRSVEIPALVALVALASVITDALVVALAQPRPQFDAVAFHLPVVVQWLQAGNTRLLPYTSPGEIAGYYPGNSELMALWAVLPVHRDFLIQMATLPGLAMVIAGTFLCARQLGARLLGALAASLLVCAFPTAIGQLVGTNMEDLFAAGALVCAVAFAARGWKQQPHVPDLVVVGLAVGLGVGARYAALVVTPIVMLLTCAPYVRRTEPVRSWLRPALPLAAGVVLTGGYFYVRNLVWTSNPLYPQPILGHHVPAPESVLFSWLRSYVSLGWAPTVWWDAVADAVRQDGPVSLSLVVAAICLPPVAALLRRERRPVAWAWVFVPAALLLAFAATPSSAGYMVHGQLVSVMQAVNLRYGYVMLPAVAAILAAEIAKLAAAWEAVIVAVVGCFSAGITIHLDATLLQSKKFALAAVLVLIVGSVVITFAHRGGRPVVAMFGAAVVVLVAATTPAMARHYDGQRLRVGMPMEAQALSLPNNVRTVAVAGTCEIYALYGPELNRRVEYLTGADNMIARPLTTTYERWLASLRSHHVTAVVTGEDVCYPIPADAPEVGWAATHPAVFKLVEISQHGRVYRLVG